jgi:hypothetical protein
VTVAANCTVPPGTIEVVWGETETAIAGAETTLTVAVSFFEVSATLVATTWYVPVMAGAV